MKRGSFETDRKFLVVVKTVIDEIPLENEREEAEKILAIEDDMEWIRLLYRHTIQ